MILISWLKKLTNMDTYPKNYKIKPGTSILLKKKSYQNYIKKIYQIIWKIKSWTWKEINSLKIQTK